MARLIVQSNGSEGGRVIELKPGVTRFGRGEYNDFPVSDPAVSDKHCEVLVDHDLVFVKDLGSTNGTYINQQPVTEAMLSSGQVLRIGPLEMLLEAAEVRVALPEMPAASAPETVLSGMLKDGYAACLNHPLRHSVWLCTFCQRNHCDECVRKLRRVGGAFLKFCPVCSNACKLSPWAELVSRRKRSLIGKVVEKIRSSFKITRHITRRLFD